MPPKDTKCPDAVDSAQAVVDLIQDKNATAAFQIVDDFWRAHHNDEEWRAFQQRIQMDEALLTLGRKENDPLVQMFNSFEIVVDKKDDSMTVSYGENYDHIDPDGGITTHRPLNNGVTKIDTDGNGIIDIKLPEFNFDPHPPFVPPGDGAPPNSSSQQEVPEPSGGVDVPEPGGRPPHSVHPSNPDGHGSTGGRDGTQNDGTPPITRPDGEKDPRYYDYSGPF